MTDREKAQRLEQAMQRVVAAERELKLARMQLKAAIDEASEPAVIEQIATAKR